MDVPGQKTIKETFRRHYRATKKATDAWNLTLDELAGALGDSKRSIAIRKAVWEGIREIMDEVLLEEGDPRTLAHHAAMESLKADKVAEACRKDAQDAEDSIKAELKKTLDLRPLSPMDWRPRGRTVADPEEKLERAYEREMERRGDNLTLYLMFDDKGGFEGWKIQYSESFGGHSGPYADVLISTETDYGDISNAIAEALSNIDWAQVEKDLEAEDGNE